MQRARVISQHLRPCPTAMGKIGIQSDDDVVVVSAYRTAITKARKGNFKDTMPDDLLAAVLEAAVKKPGVDPAVVGDIKVGNVQLGGSYAGGARIAQFRAGFPVEVPIMSINRQCSSGLTAVANIAADIASGMIDAGIGAGVESMTQGGGVTKGGQGPPPINFDAMQKSKLEMDAVVSMGQTSENVASRYGITRTDQDTLAAASHTKALAAIANGVMAAEIIPVKTIVKGKDGEEKEVIVDTDEGPRKGTSVEGLAKLKPAFFENGTTTAGNASQVSDGAGAVLLMRRSKAKEIGAPIIGVFRGYSCVGVQPDEMGVGPAVAIPAVCKQAGISVADVDIYEINEAFASQAAYCVKKLGIPMEKVNPKGGAIALGHPLGATGARQIATLMSELHRTKKKVGCLSMCIGTGMGAAGLFEAEGDKYQ